MYLEYYHLKKQPFHITPDPEFLYLSPTHKEALAGIIYGIEQRKGFVAVTGAVGVGKTTILRSYLEGANKDHLKIIYVFNANLTFEGLIRTIYQELGIPLESEDVLEMVNRLYEFLIEAYKQGDVVVLVVDEAQNMPVDTLESLRMLSNLETSKDKLIQIVLVGQPEFEEKLNLDALRQLKQRVAIRSTILPLTKEESMDYVKSRLQKAGSNSQEVFTVSALKRIVDEAKGIPRIINIFCDNALVTGFGYQRRPVPRKVVKEIIRDFSGSQRPPLTRRWLIGISALAALLAGLAWFLPYKAALVSHVGVHSSRPQKNPGETAGDVAAAEKPTVEEKTPVQPVPTEAEGLRTPPVQDDSYAVKKADSRMVRKTVEPGDTLTNLALKVYGRSDAGVIKMIQEGNPHIYDPNIIPVGSTIVFPGVPELRERVSR